MLEDYSEAQEIMEEVEDGRDTNPPGELTTLAHILRWNTRLEIFRDDPREYLKRHISEFSKEELAEFALAAFADTFEYDFDMSWSAYDNAKAVIRNAIWNARA